jgi:L-asparaginase II
LRAQFLPIFELTRGEIVESAHFGAIAVVDSLGHLLASYGDPGTVAFLRSSAKPFQVLPFVERSGVEHFGFTEKELALACASHEGSDEHVRVARSMLEKAGVDESALQCGSHMPGDVQAYKRLIQDNETPTPIRNNCSGKHSAMLAHAKMLGLPLDTYLSLEHPVQRDILASFAEMCLLPSNQIQLGIDGCSAPNFAVPLFNSALAYARLCDPSRAQSRGPQNLSEKRIAACRKITSAMTAYPEMISGPTEFDCRLMQVGAGRIVCKRGAEGFQAIGLLPGAIEPDSPGIGIAIKIMEGDLGQRRLDLTSYSRVRPAVTLEILKQLGALNEAQLDELAEFGPVKPVTNHRGIIVGESRPVFSLNQH